MAQRKAKAAAKGTRAAKQGAKSSAPDKDLHQLTDLEQMKVLADPRRIRILELLGRERTTKQVAELLGEPPTRLYHHVAALARVGLIRLARTRQARGAVEKYYVAVARAFSADPRLFTSRRAPQARQASHDVAARLLDQTAAELRALVHQDPSPAALQEEGILSYLEVQGSPSEIKAIRTKVARLIASVTAEKGKEAEKARPYRLTIAFFPMPSRT